MTAANRVTCVWVILSVITLVSRWLRIATDGWLIVFWGAALGIYLY